MYYLLEDNRVIKYTDENVLYTIETINGTYVILQSDELNPNAIFDCAEHFWFTRHLSIKQSENVFDLIEVGDLVEESDFGEIYKVKVFENGKSEYRDRTFDRYNGEMYVKYEGCGDEYYSYIETLGTINISKIYKPNAKGDYIKVWEKEN